MNGVSGSFNQLYTTYSIGFFSVQGSALWYEGESHAEEAQMESESESYNGIEGSSLFNYNHCISPFLPLRFTPDPFRGSSCLPNMKCVLAQKTR